jgi:hypothetical protein
MERQGFRYEREMLAPRAANLNKGGELMRRSVAPAALVFVLFVAGSFLYVQLTKAFDRTPCCGDDAST